MCYTMAIIKHSEDSIGMAPPQDWRNRTGQPRGLDPHSTNQGVTELDTAMARAGPAAARRI